jgi:hypothetical protein
MMYTNSARHTSTSTPPKLTTRFVYEPKNVSDGDNYLYANSNKQPCRPDSCTYCGDGIKNGDEKCDDSTKNGNSGYCYSDCSGRCGDGDLNADQGEECDPPGVTNPSEPTRTCEADCKWSPVIN